MTTSPLRHITATRKPYTCNWCNKTIEQGQPCKTWFTYGENVTARMHPECYIAMGKADLDDELPPTGTFRRGCWCEERREICECGKEKT